MNTLHPLSYTYLDYLVCSAVYNEQYELGNITSKTFFGRSRLSGYLIMIWAKKYLGTLCTYTSSLIFASRDSFPFQDFESRLFLFIIYKMLTCTIYLPYHLDEYQEQEISEGCNLVDIFYSKGFIIFSWNSNLSNLERTLNSPLLCYEESLNSCIRYTSDVLT